VWQAESNGIPDLYGVSAEPCWRCVRYYARARFPGAVGTYQLSGESVRYYARARFPGAVGTHQLSGESVRHYARARFPGAVGTHQLSGESVRHHTNTEYSIQTLMYIKLPCTTTVITLN
jgi:hypothetical protein